MAPAPDLFVVCRNCGSEVSSYVTECPYCGTRLRKRAPKLETSALGGRRSSGSGRRPAVTRLTRLRADEIPGLAGDPVRRPVVTIALVVLGALGCIALGAVARIDVAVVGTVSDRWWRIATAPFFAWSQTYVVVTLLAVLVFGAALERRHGWLVPLLLFFAGGAGGAAAAAALESPPLALGANGAAIALLTAWAAGPVLELRRDGETDADLIGVAVWAALLLALPLVVPEASATAGATGLLVGLLAGVPLARRRV